MQSPDDADHRRRYGVEQLAAALGVVEHVEEDVFAAKPLRVVDNALRVDEADHGPLVLRYPVHLPHKVREHRVCVEIRWLDTGHFVVGEVLMRRVRPVVLRPDDGHTENRRDHRAAVRAGENVEWAVRLVDMADGRSGEAPRYRPAHRDDCRPSVRRINVPAFAEIDLFAVEAHVRAVPVRREADFRAEVSLVATCPATRRRCRGRDVADKSGGCHIPIHRSFSSSRGTQESIRRDGRFESW